MSYSPRQHNLICSEKGIDAVRFQSWAAAQMAADPLLFRPCISSAVQRAHHPAASRDSYTDSNNNQRDADVRAARKHTHTIHRSPLQTCNNMTTRQQNKPRNAPYVSTSLVARSPLLHALETNVLPYAGALRCSSTNDFFEGSPFRELLPPKQSHADTFLLFAPPHRSEISTRSKVCPCP
jgi:hypothetical protein